LALFATFAVKGLFDLPIGRDETEPALKDALSGSASHLVDRGEGSV
jgi:hypothetical protein